MPSIQVAEALEYEAAAAAWRTEQRSRATSGAHVISMPNSSAASKTSSRDDMVSVPVPATQAQSVSMRQDPAMPGAPGIPRASGGSGIIAPVGDPGWEDQSQAATGSMRLVGSGSNTRGVSGMSIHVEGHATPGRVSPLTRYGGSTGAAEAVSASVPSDTAPVPGTRPAAPAKVLNRQRTEPPPMRGVAPMAGPDAAAPTDVSRSRRPWSITPFFLSWYHGTTL